MALINCPECNKEISDKAKVCPHCGYESNPTMDIKKNTIIIIVSVVVLIACIILFDYFSAKYGRLHALYFYDTNRDSVEFGAKCGKYISMTGIIVSGITMLTNAVVILKKKNVIANITK